MLRVFCHPAAGKAFSSGFPAWPAFNGFKPARQLLNNVGFLLFAVIHPAGNFVAGPGTAETIAGLHVNGTHQDTRRTGRGFGCVHAKPSYVCNDRAIEPSMANPSTLQPIPPPKSSPSCEGRTLESARSLRCVESIAARPPPWRLALRRSAVWVGLSALLWNASHGILEKMRWRWCPAAIWR